MHTYQAHPQGPWASKGEKVEQESSFGSVFAYWRDVNLRYVDRPMFVTEYGHVFWSRSRYEEGLLALILHYKDSTG